MRLELPQAIPPRDLMNASRSKGPERTRRSTAALALQRLVVQEVLVVFRAICFEIINRISHRIAIVQIVVELFAEQPGVKAEHIPVGWLVKMGAVEPRNANTAAFDLCHETYDKRGLRPQCSVVRCSVFRGREERPEAAVKSGNRRRSRR